MTQALKHTPIHTIARDGGASFAVAEGWQVVESFGQDEAALEAGRRGVAVVDCSARGKVLVEGEAATAAVQRAWEVTVPGVNEGAAIPGGHVYRLRRDRYFVSVAAGATAATVQQAEAAARAVEGLVTVTDVTHGQGELWLVGPATRELLSRLCGVDLHHEAFAKHTARESSVAKTKQLVIRRDVGPYPACALLGARSLAAYVWRTVLEAGHDLQVAPAGMRVLSRLEEDEGPASKGQPGQEAHEGH